MKLPREETGNLKLDPANLESDNEITSDLSSKPSGEKELVAGGNHTDVNPDFAISGTFRSKFLHQSCL